MSYRNGARPLESQLVRRILIIRPGGIGDAVLLIPSVRILKESFPDSEIDVLAEGRNAEVFSLCKEVTAVFLYHRVSDLARVVGRGYDVVIDTEQWHRLSAAVAFLTRASIRVGFATNERARMFTHPVPYAQSAYEANSFLDLVAPLTGTSIVFDPEAPFVSAAPYLMGGDRSQAIVVLFPGASVRERRWDDQRLSQLAAQLVQNGCRVVIVGGPNDVERSRAICAGGGPRVVNLGGKLSLKETAEVLAGSNVLVTADSGLMHLAYAVGTPTVALFGAGIQEKWAPRGGNHRVLNARLPCSPCTTFGYTPACPIDVECLRRISVDDVLAATLDVLRRAEPRGRHHARGGAVVSARSVVGL